MSFVIYVGLFWMEMEAPLKRSMKSNQFESLRVYCCAPFRVIRVNLPVEVWKVVYSACMKQVENKTTKNQHRLPLKQQTSRIQVKQFPHFKEAIG